MKIRSRTSGNLTWLGAKFSLALAIPFLLGPASVRPLSQVGALFTFHNPSLLSPAPLGQAFYVGFNDGEIVVVDSNGASTPFGNVTSAEGMAVDSSGNLLVADSSDNVVYNFTPNGTRTIFASGFSAPSDVAIDSTGKVYVADTGNNQVVQLAADGTILGIYTSNEGSPEALTFDQNDFLFIAANSDGNVIKVPPGGGPGTLFAPMAPSAVTITFDSDFTHLYEAGSTMSTIMVF